MPGCGNLSYDKLKVFVLTIYLIDIELYYNKNANSYDELLELYVIYQSIQVYLILIYLFIIELFTLNNRKYPRVVKIFPEAC